MEGDHGGRLTLWSPPCLTPMQTCRGTRDAAPLEFLYGWHLLPSAALSGGLKCLPRRALVPFRRGGCRVHSRALRLPPFDLHDDVGQGLVP